MDAVPIGALIDELVFLEAWEGGLLPTVSGLVRVRQFHRARPEQIAQHRMQQAREVLAERAGVREAVGG